MRAPAGAPSAARPCTDAAARPASPAASPAHGSFASASAASSPRPRRGQQPTHPRDHHAQQARHRVLVRRRHRMKHQPARRVLRVHAIEGERVHVYVEIQCRPESLQDRHAAAATVPDALVRTIARTHGRSRSASAIHRCRAMKRSACWGHALIASSFRFAPIPNP